MPSLPTNSPEYWRERFYKVVSLGKELHETIYVTDPATWNNIQSNHSYILRELIKRGCIVLDAGCGYGALYDIMNLNGRENYIGIDISNELIQVAKTRNPKANFYVMDMTSTPFKDRTFDLAICRSISGMTIENLGNDEWRKMATELFRISKSLLLLSYSEPDAYTLIDTAKQTIEDTISPPTD